MGAVGAAIASTIARYGAAGLMLWYILSRPDGIASGVRGPWETVWGPGGWRAGYQMRKLGASAGISNGFETIGFAAMSLMAGTLGIAALDAYSISHNLLSTFFWSQRNGGSLILVWKEHAWQHHVGQAVAIVLAVVWQAHSFVVFAHREVWFCVRLIVL